MTLKIIYVEKTNKPEALRLYQPTVSLHFSITAASNGCHLSLFTSGPQMHSVSWYT